MKDRRSQKNQSKYEIDKSSSSHLEERGARPCPLTPAMRGAGRGTPVFNGLGLCIIINSTVYAGDWLMKLANEELRIKRMITFIEGAVRRSRILTSLKDGQVSQEDVLKDYKTMLDRVRSQITYFENKKGEIVKLRGASRWIEGSSYRGIVKNKLEEILKREKKVRHLVLTVSKERVEKIIPDWFTWGWKVFLAIFGNICMSFFIKNLYREILSKEDDWRYLCAVLEFHESGAVHWHIIFGGSWILHLDYLWKYWPIAEFQGLRFDKKQRNNAEQLAGYLTWYLTKDFTVLSEKGEVLSLACLYFFKKRFYNTRHVKKSNEVRDLQ